MVTTCISLAMNIVYFFAFPAMSSDRRYYFFIQLWQEVENDKCYAHSNDKNNYTCNENFKLALFTIIVIKKLLLNINNYSTQTEQR